MGVFLLDLLGNELLIKTCVISIFFVFLIKAKCVGRGGGERGAGSQGRREMWSEVMERGNLRQTGRFRAQRGRQAWKDKIHGLRQDGKEAEWPQDVQDKRGARRAERKLGSEDEGEQFAPKELS